MRILNAPAEYAIGKNPDLIAIRVDDLFRYEGKEKTDDIIGQVLTLGLVKTFERFRVKIGHQRKKITNEQIEAANAPIHIALINCRVSDYVMNGNLGLTFTADDYEVIDNPSIDLEMEGI